ncbi:MAG: nucleotide exchange factor GrpE [Deltaproteobacteria bacterium]|nr:nucleotide exchange factor GrpE [Deltaproteobacteria bacterium]
MIFGLLNKKYFDEVLERVSQEQANTLAATREALEKLSELEKRVSTVERQCLETLNRVSPLENKLSGLEDKFEDNSYRLTSIEGKIFQNSSLLASFDKTLSQAADKLDGIEDWLSKISTEFNEFRQALSGMEEKFIQVGRSDRRQQAALANLLDNHEAIMTLLRQEKSSERIGERLMAFGETLLLWLYELEPSEETSILFNKFQALINEFGLESFGAEVGEPFDPVVHEACHVDYNPALEDGAILELVRPGFRSKEGILRYALVVVNRHQAGKLKEMYESEFISDLDQSGHDIEYRKESQAEEELEEELKEDQKGEEVEEVESDDAVEKIDDSEEEQKGLDREEDRPGLIEPNKIKETSLETIAAAPKLESDNKSFLGRVRSYIIKLFSHRPQGSDKIEGLKDLNQSKDQKNHLVSSPLIEAGESIEEVGQKEKLNIDGANGLSGDFETLESENQEPQEGDKKPPTSLD